MIGSTPSRDGSTSCSFVTNCDVEQEAHQAGMGQEVAVFSQTVVWNHKEIKANIK